MTEKCNFIKAATDCLQLHSNPTIYVLQMYSPSVTACGNKAMLKRKERKRDGRTIQAYVKYSDILMVRKSSGRSYYAYTEI